jgi:hypothetical protein
LPLAAKKLLTKQLLAQKPQQPKQWMLLATKPWALLKVLLMQQRAQPMLRLVLLMQQQALLALPRMPLLVPLVPLQMQPRTLVLQLLTLLLVLRRTPLPALPTLLPTLRKRCNSANWLEFSDWGLHLRMRPFFFA